MSYNWKCCSFYPNNFDASALISVVKCAYLGRDTCVPRSGFVCTSVGVHAYLGRGTMTIKSLWHTKGASLNAASALFYLFTSSFFFSHYIRWNKIRSYKKLRHKPVWLIRVKAEKTHINLHTNHLIYKTICSSLYWFKSKLPYIL